jgi:hypothetical protein
MIKIAIHSAPRSGSSWLGQIFNSSPKTCFRFQPLFSYAFKGYLNEKSSQEDISNFFEKIAESDDDFLLQRDKVENGEYPSFSKDDEFTHIVYKEVRYHNIIKNMLTKDKELKVIGLIRSPFAVIDSFLRSTREFREDLGWKEIEEWKIADKKNLNKPEEFFGYEKWKEVYFIFKELEIQYKDRFCMVYYEDLIKDTVNEIERVFNFCNLEVNMQTIKFLNDSKSSERRSVYSVFRDKLIDDKWKDSLNELIFTEISNDLKTNNMNQFLSAK